MKQIFIGGSGRSGTTICLHVLYKHPDLYAVPFETKFIVEVDGLADLVNFMTVNYSVTATEESKARFKNLLTNVITCRGKNPYKVTDAYGKQEFLIQDIFENYDTAIENFMSVIRQNSYFQDRNELILESKKLIDNLFELKARSMNKIGWVEKTPSNISRIEFLNEVYPDNEFVHMIRDPRGVLFSLQRLGWCSTDLDFASRQLKQQLQNFILNRKIAEKKNYKIIDIKLEDLVANTSDIMTKITDFLNIPEFPQENRNYLIQKLSESSMKYDKNKDRVVDSWERGFNKEQMSLIQKNLAEEITLLGYPLV